MTGKTEIKYSIKTDQKEEIYLFCPSFVPLWPLFGLSFVSLWYEADAVKNIAGKGTV